MLESAVSEKEHELTEKDQIIRQMETDMNDKDEKMETDLIEKQKKIVYQEAEKTKLRREITSLKRKLTAEKGKYKPIKEECTFMRIFLLTLLLGFFVYHTKHQLWAEGVVYHSKLTTLLLDLIMAFIQDENSRYSIIN